jgi:hypothetical protein
MTPGIDRNQIVCAMSEPLSPKQVVVMGANRWMVLRELTREEFDGIRRQNAAIRERFGRQYQDHVGVVTGEDPGHLDPATLTHPPEPPPNCTYFYEIAEL